MNNNHVKLFEQAKIHVQEYVARNPRATRKERYGILASITGIDERTARSVDRYLRAIRAVIEIDEVGRAREAAWHKTPQAWKFENETRQTYLKLVL
jgi:hypothetical protein